MDWLLATPLSTNPSNSSPELVDYTMRLTWQSVQNQDLKQPPYLWPQTAALFSSRLYYKLDQWILGTTQCWGSSRIPWRGHILYTTLPERRCIQRYYCDLLLLLLVHAQAFLQCWHLHQTDWDHQRIWWNLLRWIASEWECETEFNGQCQRTHVTQSCSP